MPDWRAVTRSVAERVGIDPDIFERQIRQESGFDPNAGSPAGALGIAQIVPKYHPTVDPLDPYAALAYAATWMKRLYGQYGNWRDALIHYNGGGGAIQRWRSGRPIEESVQYINAILGPGKAEAAELEPNGTAGDPTMASPQQTSPSGYGSPEIDRIIAAKGDPISIRPLDPEVEREIQGVKTGQKLPNPTPKYEFVFRDGTTLEVQTAEGGRRTVVGGTALASAAAADKPKAAEKPTIVGGNSPNERWIVTQKPDGSFAQRPNPNYVPPKEPKEPAKPNNKSVVTRNGKSYIYDPDTNTFAAATGLPDEAEKPKRSTHTFGGRIYTTDENGNVVNSADVRTAEEKQAAGLGIQKTQMDLAEGSLDLEKKKRDLLPKQQQIIQGHYDTIKYVQGMLERGEIEPSQADAYVSASRLAADTALQGTTPFALREAEETADRERKKMGVDLVTQRISSGGALASGLMSSAASLGSRAMLRPGQTSLGVDPLAAAMAFMQQTNSVAQEDPLTAGLLSAARTPPPMPTLPPGAPAGI